MSTTKYGLDHNDQYVPMVPCPCGVSVVKSLSNFKTLHVDLLLGGTVDTKSFMVMGHME